MIETQRYTYFYCDCIDCNKSDSPVKLVACTDIAGDAIGFAQENGWHISPNGRFCCSPGHEGRLGTISTKKQTHKHH